ncbi:thymidine kinase [uncultured Finegoldia sp.]|uniref:thymidine kinase n=1 Tax=uncultured Finegoldia sp. TaxID=328009 RepID=UPI0026397085|nr:thymidine kinase [uncultured Finegoldia sp.]
MHQYKGKLIVHTGSMFSGKTSSLWKEVNRFRIAKYKVAVFKPKMDSRYSKEKVVTHDKNEMEAINVDGIEEIVEYTKTHDVNVIAIDEVQFINSKPKIFTDNINFLLENGYTIIVAGLDMDYEAKPFQLVKELLPICDYLEKHHAVCAICGNDAWVSYRISDDKNRIQLGASETYQPLCRKHYIEKMRDKKISELQTTYLKKEDKNKNTI